ncbi:MAG: hypothetical protein ACT6FE_03775 [Methanosarcinaceae archaeon]
MNYRIKNIQKDRKDYDVKNKSNKALIRLRTHRDLITEKSRKEFTKLKEAILNNYDVEHANSIYTRLCDFSHTKHELTEISNNLNISNDDVPEFIVSSEVLYLASQKLCSISTESILYAVGNNYGNSYSIERLIELELDQSKFGYAKANDVFNLKTMIELEKYGTLLTCYFHAHPSSGINSNHPSDIDYSTQKRLESGNYKTIGGIFSRDGYLRFFTDKLEFKITILGKGVEHVSKNVYKLTEIS